MQKSETIAALADALAKAQGEIENASKNAANPHFKSRYADLAEVLNTVRPVFAKHGLAVTQFPSFDGGVAHVETILTHSSGEWMSGIASAPVGKQDAQGVGSAVTYLRRYSLAAVAGVAQEDDDGRSVVGKPSQQQAPIAAIKPPLSADRFAKAVESVKAGNFDKLKLLSDYDLTKEQRKEAAAL